MNHNYESNVGSSPPQPGRRPLSRLGPWLLLAFWVSLCGTLVWGRPALAQDQGPIIIHKLASVEEVDLDETVEYSITIQNVGFDLSPTLVMTDPIPAEIALDPTSLTGGATFDEKTRTVSWQGQLKLSEQAVIRYRGKVQIPIEVAKCSQVITNIAHLSAPAVRDGAAIVIAPAPIVIKLKCPDLGDAPDSTNHAGAGMLAYPATPATYPTVYDPATGAPPGPRHLLPRFDVWLGPAVTRERDADLLPDEDGVRNIDPVAGLPDQDKADDGVIRWPQPAPCTPTDMDVQVNVVGGVRQRYINVWIDWNRNGSWNDLYQCPGALGSEWVVRNFPTNLGNGLHNITLPTFLPPGQLDSLDHWVRVSIADGLAPSTPANPIQSDGRGVAIGYRFGETEDYLRRFEPPVQGEPKLEIRKQASVGAVLPGGTIEYTVTVANTGTGPATGVTVYDPIPAGTSYVPGSVNSIPAGAIYDNINNRIAWIGNIPAGGNVTITFKVLVSPQIDCNAVIKNVAAIMGASGPIATAEALVKVECPPPGLRIEKKANVAAVVPGGIIEYTIVVVNTGGPATGVTIVDPIPAGTTYVPGSVNSLPPGATYNVGLNRVEWTGNIPAGGNLIIKFKVLVNPQIDCPTEIKNEAAILAATGALGGSASTVVKVECPPKEKITDFGDAPDSDSNHHAKPNTAYATGPVLGHFPSVWDGTPATEGSGPNHQDAGQYWLGAAVTSEKDADLLPDDDTITNILNNGVDDVANHDKADDGWLNPNAPLDNCRETTLKVHISRSALPPSLNVLYLNVWFDGNRDGDWNDIGECPQIKARAFEWIVQNWTLVNPAAIPATGIDVAVPTVLVHNLKPDADAWLRFTLSEQPAVAALPGLPDGRGPAAPNAFFRLGETEDYYRKGETQGQPGEIRIDKKADPAGPVNVGDVINYAVFVSHVGGTVPAFTTMQDVLPPGVVLVGGPTVTELNPSVVPLVASFGPGGPSGTVSWSGSLSPGAMARIDFQVRVRECVDLLRNVAKAKNTNGQIVEAVAETKVNCQPTAPGIKLEKTVRVGNAADPAVDADLLPGDAAVYYLNLSSTDGLSHTVHISDDLPSGLIAVATSTSSGVANIINAGQTVVWDGVVGPANSPVTIKILVRQVNLRECAQQLVNIAKWFTTGFSGQSNPVTLRLSCRDLGDAPDSTNHANAPMSAYPGVGAKYPTVFAVAAPERGPRHERPRPFHLGKGVTAEVEADLGFDADGVNNLRPPANVADQDKADDGLLLSTVSLRHCQTGTMRVQVSIDPGAAALLPNGTGYLNVWIDSNRDGDWADRLECPTATGAAGSAVEHIVIDHPVNAAALGAGLHIINVPTTGLVSWPDADAQKPAWLRLTLSERPANKPLAGPVGDGRGYDDPFRLGETEDYLFRQENLQGSADPVVTKRGEIWPDFNPETGQRRWLAGWIINYANLGSAPASNVHVIDTFDPPQTLVAEHSIPLVPHTQSGNTLDYNVGPLAVGGTGMVIIRTEIPFNTAPGTVIKNSVVVNSDNDGNPLNNTGVATVTVPLLPPFITSPLAGTTCTTTVKVEGQAQANVTVDLYVDNVLHSTLTADANGDWSATLNLAAGNHSLYAVARAGSQTSAPSPTIMIVVDTSLFWDPISLRFQDELGHTIIPSGRLDETGWSIFLRPGHTYTVSLRVCCADPNAQVKIEIGDIEVTLNDPDGDHIYTGTFSIPQGGRFTGSVRICVTCNLIRICTDGTVLIDPEGTVFDILTGSPLDSANVACMQAGVSTSEVGAANDAGPQLLTLWPAADFGQVNPQVVAQDGYFSFFTPAGTYRLNVNKAGYQAYESPDLTVVDAPVHFDVPLTPLVSQAADQQIAITDGGFEPAVVTVKAGAVVEWINTGSSIHTSTSITPSLSFSGTAQAAAASNTGWDSGLLQSSESYKRQLSTPGTYTYHDATKPEFTATIIVQEGAVTSGQSLYLPVVVKQ